MTEGVVMVKCLVWDLDNTLWRGILLEGDRVVLPAEVRATIVELDSRGILQSVSSKNDHDTAWARLEELGIAEYFVLSEIGWGPKSDSLRRIAERLNFAHRTMAFIDDQPAEHAEVCFHLPEIRCYRADQADVLTGLPEFSPAVTTMDSRLRRRMYQAGFRRDAERAEFLGPDEEFLRSLELSMGINRAGEHDLSRVEELTLRTSQMNATGVHYSHATLCDLLDDPWHEVLVVTMTDRFGPHGAVGIVLLEKHPRVWHLKLLATSCRVVSFGAGSAVLSWLADQAATARVHLVADFRRTDRNRMMEIAYRFADFRDQPCACTAVLAGPADLDGLHRLHLEPSPQSKSTTVQISAPQLSSRRGERATHG
ncbi:MAG: HAD-IIIC family phosphatase [Pseudonocardiaceae bacterium]